MTNKIKISETKYHLLIVAFTTVALASSVQARRADFNQLPTEARERVAAQAAELGFDLSTEEGRRAFGDHMRDQREARAVELGFDLSTREGRQAFHENHRSQVEQIAETNGFDLSTPDGRQSLRSYLAENNQLGLLPPPRGPRQGRGGPEFLQLREGSESLNGEARPPRERFGPPAVAGDDGVVRRRRIGRRGFAAPQPEGGNNDGA